MSKASNTPRAFMSSILALRDGLANNPPKGLTQIIEGGKTYSNADLMTELDGYVTVLKKAEDAAKEREMALQARDALIPIATKRFESMKASIKTTVGKRNPELKNLGIEPDQAPAQLTPEQKLQAAAKARATRAARHTMGPKQKAAIKGQAPAPDAPPPAPPAPPKQSSSG